jgi:hypothetical protein
MTPQQRRKSREKQADWRAFIGKHPVEVQTVQENAVFGNACLYSFTGQHWPAINQAEGVPSN